MTSYETSPTRDTGTRVWVSHGEPSVLWITWTACTVSILTSPAVTPAFCLDTDSVDTQKARLWHVSWPWHTYLSWWRRTLPPDCPEWPYVPRLSHSHTPVWPSTPRPPCGGDAAPRPSAWPCLQRPHSQWHFNDMFCCISFYLILSHSVSFYLILSHSISFHSIPFHSIPFHSIPFHSIPFHSIPFHSIPFHFISFHFISFHFISFHFISFHFISFHSIIFHSISFSFILVYLLHSSIMYSFYRMLLTICYS